MKDALVISDKRIE